MINGIVCVDENWGIGKVDENGNGQLLFHLKKDMAFFKETTLHSAVVMGYNTYLSLPEKFRPLPDRLNIILYDKATSPDCLPDCITFKDFNALLTFVQQLAKAFVLTLRRRQRDARLAVVAVEFTNVRRDDRHAKLLSKFLGATGFRSVRHEGHHLQRRRLHAGQRLQKMLRVTARTA